ncbi:hypothetical protein EJ02DRAFT_32338 [Clathrospora elynae]|uniref:Mediator of RNA polymerase II transcription subunit 13 n=1 Tax=Clathrospora elynae TaxID=706981 RepID=A0A6A5SFH3_9PLEO|nr:hypothetical protein EJ02DRAFT_32338 [Clathrospora elynae]
MEFLKTCHTNAQAIGDFEAIAYQAFSVTRTTTTTTTTPTSTSSKLRDWSPSDDTRAAEAELRQHLHLIAHDASRPWLWLFKPTTVEKAGHNNAGLPELDGYSFQREQVGSIKALDLVRPPMRAANPNATSTSTTSPSTPAPHRGLQPGGTRLSQGTVQPHGFADAPQPPDFFTLYELFTSSVVALISFNIVKDCNVIALNCRTFASKVTRHVDHDDAEIDALARVHWLTGLKVHWTSSGTLLVSTLTELNTGIRCVDSVSTPAEEKQLIGRCIRVAPNGLLATVASFDDPLESIAEDLGLRHRKRAKFTSLEQNIEQWKSNVRRWLGWKGYTLSDLDKRTAWVRIRTALAEKSTASSPVSAGPDRDILWPRALCFFHIPHTDEDMGTKTWPILAPETCHTMLKWFETPEFMGFKDPFDVAQEWFLGKSDRDKVLEAERKAKKAEEDAARRKEEQHGLYPSSPLNARGGVYGDLQAASGVYPTPPDGIAPGTGFSHSDTPSVSGTASNVILAPGGGTPAINLSAPQHDSKTDEQRMSLTSPVLPSASDAFNTSSGNDDLFEDMEEDGYGGDGINDADFDFFDGPDDEDVDMLDAPAPTESNETPIRHIEDAEPTTVAETQAKEDISDPLAALENALATASQPAVEEVQEIQEEQPVTARAPSAEHPEMHVKNRVHSPTRGNLSFSKESTPPLSPSMIVKALQPSPPNNSTVPSQEDRLFDHQPNSAFGPLSFSRQMSMSDAKYQSGRFSASQPKDLANGPKTRSGSGTGPPQMKGLRDFPLLTRLRYTAGVASANKIPEITSLARADSGDSDSESSNETSDVSDEDSEEDMEPMPVTIMGSLIKPTKRKLQSEGNATPLSVTSFAESLGGDWQDLHGLQLDEATLSSFEPSPLDWSLVNFPAPAERPATGARYSMPTLPPYPAQMPDTPTSQPDFTFDIADEKPVMGGKDSIAITQIVTDQIVAATLDILGEDPPIGRQFDNISSAETRWHSIIKKIFPSAADCDVPALAAVHEVFQEYAASEKAQQRASARRSDGPSITGSHMYQISPPYLRVRRADTHWDLLPPAIAFWEPLGLSPASPPKNIVTFCVYPHSDALRPCLENFLLNLQLAYDNCKLGSHSRVEAVVEFEGGLVPVRITRPITQRETFKVLKDTCIQLGKLLAIHHAKIREQQDSNIDAFVIYMIDPYGGSSMLWELCSAFWALFQAYGQGPPGRPDQPQKPDLVLQVVPMKYVASFDAPIILDPSTYINLAREVYDRCPPSAPCADKTSLSIYTAPAFHLEETLPRNIPFKLVSEPAQDLLRENTYMHLAYAISLDGTWITAAWTDSCGKSQAVVSYHLGTRLFREIAKEIWQTTVEILQSRRVNWRICIAKAGVLDREELESWVFLISRPTPINVFVTLLTAVDADPSYKFTPMMPASTNAAGAATTPGSTPQAGVSPDPAVGLTPAATPSADSAVDPSADPEARLVDVTDETWGVILAHRLHNSHSTTQFSPALISGLLVKRGETQATSNSISHPLPDPEQGPIVLGVNFLWIGAVGSTRAATSPFPPSSASISSSDVPSPGSTNPYASNPGTNVEGGQRNTTSLLWTPSPPMRNTAEGLLKEVLGQFRALGLLAKLRGMRGTRGGVVPWHVVAAKRGVEGLGKVMGGS